MRARRRVPEGSVPLLSVEGSAFECGVMLGKAWCDTLRLSAQRFGPGERAWWTQQTFQKLVDRYAPHLPELFRGMAKGAGVPAEKVGAQPLPHKAPSCTSFALQRHVTLDRTPISGQTKDTSSSRTFLYLILRLKLTDAPSALTLTYPGWLFGHGFVKGRCAVFRNSLFAGVGHGELPYEAWGLLALHCESVEEVVELTRKHGVRVAGHCTIADEKGSIVGIEVGRGGIAVLRPERGIYTHANAIRSSKRLLRYEELSKAHRENSLFRERRLRERLEAERGRLTVQLVCSALSDHERYPLSICRHEKESFQTTAVVIVQPTNGRLFTTRGAPCQNPLVRYSL